MQLQGEFFFSVADKSRAFCKDTMFKIYHSTRLTVWEMEQNVQCRLRFQRWSNVCHTPKALLIISSDTQNHLYSIALALSGLEERKAATSDDQTMEIAPLVDVACLEEKRRAWEDVFDGGSD
jgi:hypothetical protein